MPKNKKISIVVLSLLYLQSKERQENKKNCASTIPKFVIAKNYQSNKKNFKYQIDTYFPIGYQNVNAQQESPASGLCAYANDFTDIEKYWNGLNDTDYPDMGGSGVISNFPKATKEYYETCYKQTYNKTFLDYMQNEYNEHTKSKRK